MNFADGTLVTTGGHHWQHRRRVEDRPGERGRRGPPEPYFLTNCQIRGRVIAFPARRYPVNSLCPPLRLSGYRGLSTPPEVREATLPSGRWIAGFAPPDTANKSRLPRPVPMPGYSPKRSCMFADHSVFMVPQLGQPDPVSQIERIPLQRVRVIRRNRSTGRGADDGAFFFRSGARRGSTLRRQ